MARKQICECCFKEFIITNPKSHNQIYCSTKCKNEMKKYYYTTRKIKLKVKQPDITINDVVKFQLDYKERTGKWISYTEAAKKLEGE